MGKEERITIDAHTYGQYFETNPNSIELQLTVKKGIWDYYVIEKWEIKKQQAITQYQLQGKSDGTPIAWLDV